MGRPPCRTESSDLKKGPWTPEEDQVLVNYIQKHGHDTWRALPKHAGLNRCGKSCRLRWINYLRPDIKRGKFSEEEENLIITLHSALGNKWSRIGARLPGRTDNEIKNFWNTGVRKKLLKEGIDPKTHRLIRDLGFLIDTVSRLTSLSPSFSFKAPGIMSRPWMNGALGCRSDATQLTNLNNQLLHNMLQIVNITPLSTDQLPIDETINQYAMDHSDEWVKYINNVNLEPPNDCNAISSSSMGSYGGGSRPPETFTDHKSLSDNFFIESQLPGFSLPMSPGEEPTNKQMIIKNSPESNAFEAGWDDENFF